MRFLLSLLAIVGLAGMLPLAVPGTAHACSCAYAPDGPRILEQVSHSAAAFTGTPTAERVDGNTAYFEFDVREVFDGEVGTTTVVSSSVQGSACGRGFTLDTEYLVFASRHDTRGAAWSVESCSATTESTNTRTRDAAISVYGTPRTPDPQTHSVGLDGLGSPLWQKLVATAAAVITAVVLLRFGLRAVARRRSGG